MVRRMIVWAGVMCLIAGALSLSGCEKIAEKAAERAMEEAIEGESGNEVDISDGGVTIEGDDGATAAIGEGAAIPPDFPKDVPVYAGTVLGAFSDDKSYTLQIETPDDPKTVIDYYVAELGKQGWEKESQADMGEGAMYAAKKDGNRKATIVAGASGGDDAAKTSLTVTVGQE